MADTNPGVRASHRIIEAGFDPAPKEFDRLFNALIENIENGSEIIADITFGSKPFPFVLLGALNFAELFKGASILNIVYGKVEFMDQKPSNPVLYDITSLYYLQKCVGALSGISEESARKMLNSLFAL